MKKILIAACMLLSFSPAYGILSPLNQSITEIEAILKSPDLNQTLPQSDSIQTINRVEKGYVVITNEYQMLVEMHYGEHNHIGPQTFNLIFHHPEKLTVE